MNRNGSRLRARRCVLFVPGDRPDRYAKALASGADAICIDLEDAVRRESKDFARQETLTYLEAGVDDGVDHGVEIILRINSPRSEEGLRDLLALLSSRASPHAVMIPKTDSAEEVRWVEELLPSHLGGVVLIPMIETPRGLSAVEDIAAASSQIGALMLGGVDLALELGCTRGWASLLYARSRLVHAAARVGAEVIDVPLLDVSDDPALLAEAEAVRDLGFTGKAAIHPDQVATIQQVFRPSEEELDRARKIVQAFEQSERGVLLVDGALVERPVVRAAQRILAAHGR